MWDACVYLAYKCHIPPADILDMPCTLIAKMCDRVRQMERDSVIQAAVAVRYAVHADKDAFKEFIDALSK